MPLAAFQADEASTLVRVFRFLGMMGIGEARVAQIAAGEGAADPAGENRYNRGRLENEQPAAAGQNATFAMLPQTRALLTAFFEEFWERTDLGEWWS